MQLSKLMTAHGMDEAEAIKNRYQTEQTHVQAKRHPSPTSTESYSLDRWIHQKALDRASLAAEFTTAAMLVTKAFLTSFLAALGATLPFGGAPAPVLPHRGTTNTSVDLAVLPVAAR